MDGNRKSLVVPLRHAWGEEAAPPEGLGGVCLSFTKARGWGSSCAEAGNRREVIADDDVGKGGQLDTRERKNRARNRGEEKQTTSRTN